MGRIRSLIKRMIRPSKPEAPRQPPPFVLDPGQQGLESAASALIERISGGETVVFVDVRAGNERDIYIPDAVAMRIGEVPSRWTELDKEALVICYCATGGQSINAAELLREKGLKSATSILGGLPAWEDAGGTVAHKT
jgi:adenylyltransferase/sulfurtransferase